MYQWGLVNSIVNTIIFFSIIQPYLIETGLHDDSLITLEILNHTVPCLILILDFFINCVPFIMRHYWLYAIIQIFLIVQEMHDHYNAMQSRLFRFTDNTIAIGYIAPILVFILSLIVYFIMVQLYKLKLRLANKPDALEQLQFIF
jgi:EamA domain-containing membrane protein RarD